MKKLLVLLLIAGTAGFVFAQNQNKDLSAPDPTVLGADSANFALREVSIDLFEREGSWNVKMSPDYGIITGRFFEGGPDPEAKSPIETTGDEKPADTRTYGVKVEFFRRGINSFFITPSQPLAIDGVAKTVSVWVAGRNQNHTLTLLVRDFFGNNFELYMGSLAFTGWKQMVVAVPPSPDGKRGIVQDSAYFSSRPGLSVVGFRVDCDPEVAFGTYYIYFDDLRAVSDMYAFENHDPYDMMDNW